MVFLLPASPVHAATPTVSLSTISSGKLTATTSGTPGSIVVITGTGFSPSATVSITTTVGTTTVPWLTGATGVSTTTPEVDSLVVGGLLTTTASGNFQVEVLVPNMPGGAQTIAVATGTVTGTATITVTPSISITYPTNYGYPQESISPTITVLGFGSGESVSIATAVWASASTTCTTGASVSTVTGTGYGSCAVTESTAVADATGGAHSITATGATSGLTATTTYTINPWAAFYNSQAGGTTFSFVGSAPTSILVEAHGLPAGTIAASSITIGGVSTNHAAVTVGTSGAFGGAGTFLVVSPTTNVPFGPVSVVIDGTTFNYANGNIKLSPTAWGGVLISSIVGSGTSTGVATTDASSYKPGAVQTPSTTSTAPRQNTIGVFGYGFVPGSPITITPSAGAVLTAILVPGSATASGAFFSTQALGETPWSLTATPTTAETYTLTVTEASPPANILSPSFGITPWIDTTTGGLSASTVDYTVTNFRAYVHGFGATDSVTLAIGGTALTGSTSVATNGEVYTAAAQVPDLAGGVQTITATGSVSGAVATAAGAVTYAPTVNSIGGIPPTGVSALSINQGGAGQTTVVRTGNGYGIHGLLADTAYSIVWNAISGSQILGTFTTTATGGVPIPGVQVTIPSDSSGVHILDIETASGASAIFGNLVAGQLVPGDDVGPANFPDGLYTSAYGDLLFSNIALLSASPSVAAVGAAETLTGTGLASGGSYVVALGTSVAGTVLTSAPALATFTATSTGAVPSGVSITLADTPTTTETGTVEYFSVQTTAHYGVTGAEDAYAEFVLASSANLNMSSAPIGHAVILTAHALNPSAVYDIVFNYVQSAFVSTSYTGTTVGVIAPNSVGAGSATFDVPAGAASGPTVVQLVVSKQGTTTPAGAPVGTAILNTPLSVTVGSVSSTSCNSTSCVSATGSPTQSTQGVYNGVTTTFTNHSNAPITGFVYAVVHNALGQTVDISTATISAPAGGSVTAFNALFGLPPGTYSVTIFVTSSSGTAISTTSTASVTIS